MHELRIPLPDSPDLVAITTPRWLIDIVHNTLPDWMISTLYPYGVWVIENPLWSCLIILTTSLVLGIMDSVQTRKFVCYLEKNPDKIASIWQDGPIVLGHREGVDRVCVRTTDGREYVVG